MPVSVDGFLKHLSDSGVLSVRELTALESKIPVQKRRQDARALASELVRLKKLTPFQATVLCEENPLPLLLGNYVLQDKIGAGGIGVVYKAQHRRMKRTVAIKVLSQTSVQSKQLLKRFLREAEAAAKLIHQNIVTAFDADEINGVPFLAMEYVDGVDLHVYVSKHGPMAVDKAIDCITQAARGLEHAHSLGIIHRDIKPANILLDVQGIVKILDMGLVRIKEGFAPLSTSESTDTVDVAPVTQNGTICGTVDFMSPEQALDSSQADHSSDIYSLGATFYFLMSGKAMYDRPNLIDRIMAHREEPLPSICSIKPNVPAQIDFLFHRMVAKLPQDRYATMTELIHDLNHWQDIDITQRPARSPAKSRSRSKSAGSNTTGNKKMPFVAGDDDYESFSMPK
jgi:eukaryotic-like serine/threonine-protein kinase